MKIIENDDMFHKKNSVLTINDIRTNRPWIPTTTILSDDGRLIDKVDIPFVDDPDSIGLWEPIDLVEDKCQFNINEQNWKGQYHFTKMRFSINGKISFIFSNLVAKVHGVWIESSERWTKGYLIAAHPEVTEITCSFYEINTKFSSPLMFLEWKMGDYIYRYEKPWYLILKKLSL